MFSVVLGRGTSHRCPRVTDQGNASLELCHRKDLSLVSGGKTTKEFAGYSGVPTPLSQTSLSSTQQPPLAMPEGAKDMLEPYISWDILGAETVLGPPAAEWPPQNCVPAGPPCSPPARKSLRLVLVLSPACTAAGPLHSHLYQKSPPWEAPSTGSLPAGRYLLVAAAHSSFSLLAQASRPTPAVGDPPRVCTEEPARGEQPTSISRPLEPQSRCWCAQRALSC